MPLLLGKDGKKLSKRKNPTSIFYFRDSGYLPEALLNFLSLMGYSMPSGKEKHTLQEMIMEFDPKRIRISGAFFDTQKLDYLNQQYIIASPENTLLQQIEAWGLSPEFMQQLIPLARQRMKTLGDFFQLCDFFFINDLHLTTELLLPKNIIPEIAASFLQCMIWYMDEKEDWTGPSFEKASHEAAQHFQIDYKKMAIPLLFASIMGKASGPSLFESVTLLKKDRARVRLMHAIELLGGLSNKKLDPLKKSWDKRGKI
jgi:glutamyl-tRNA synthetase